MGAVQITENVKLFVLIIVIITVVSVAFSFGNSVPKTVEENPAPLDMQERVAAIDQTNQRNKVLDEWAPVFNEYKQGVDLWDSAMNSWTTLAKDDYGKIGSASIFPQAYITLDEKGSNALTFIDQNNQRFIAAEVNPRALTDQINNKRKESGMIINQMIFDLMLILRSSQDERIAVMNRGEPTNVVDNKIDQINRVVDQLRSAQTQVEDKT